MCSSALSSDQGPNSRLASPQRSQDIFKTLSRLLWPQCSAPPYAKYIQQLLSYHCDLRGVRNRGFAKGWFPKGWFPKGGFGRRFQDSKNRTRVQKTEQQTPKPERGYKKTEQWSPKPERGHIRQNHPFTKPPSCFLSIFKGQELNTNVLLSSCSGNPGISKPGF